MKQLIKRYAGILFLVLSLVCFAGTALASDDNSLQSLGITTEGVTVTPEFAYDTWSYDVVVPAGTTELALNPLPSSSVATIASVTGTTLNPDGTGTVLITVRAQSGAEFAYTLNVTTAAGAPPAQPEPAPAPETEPPTEPPTEPQTEDSRFVRVDKNTIQEAENTITALKNEIGSYRETVSLYTRIMYGLIGLAVILLFVIINLILRKRDLKAELNDYRRIGYGGAGQRTSQKGGKKQGASASQMPPQERMAREQMPQGRPQNGPGRAVPAQPSGAMYRHDNARIDVTPQVSSKKNRILPEYQEEPAGMGQQPGVNAKPAPGAKGRHAPAPQ